MTKSRASGILLHPTSLPGALGIGDLGPAAYGFVDFLVASGQTLWQMLPLTPVGRGNSPYSSYSAFAGNTLLISPQHLTNDHLLDPKEIEGPAAYADDQVDFESVSNFKNNLLRQCYATFERSRTPFLQEAFAEFCRRHQAWLDDYALFQAIRHANNGAQWIDWETDLANRKPATLAAITKKLHDDMEAQKFYQFLFFKQWFALKKYCNAQGVRLMGDLPIFVAHDSADVWTTPEQFKLDSQGRPVVVAGVPPDYFSETGQFWGNPLYDWQQMRAQDFNWWVRRMRLMLETFDLVRIDHFRGFVACWEIPAHETTAEHGHWVDVPGRELFTTLRRELGQLPIIAEDLGLITPDVERLRDELGFPGMRVLQFAFSSDEHNPHLPQNYVHHTVAYTATHDTNTTVGWFGEKWDHEREACLKYLNTDGREIHWSFIEAVSASVADIVMIPVQDVFGLGSEARMNVPNSAEGNWGWRVAPGALTSELAERLKETAARYGR